MWYKTVYKIGLEFIVIAVIWVIILKLMHKGSVQSRSPLKTNASVQM